MVENGYNFFSVATMDFVGEQFQDCSKIRERKCMCDNLEMRRRLLLFISLQVVNFYE